MTEKALNALTSAIYLARHNVTQLTDDDEKIRASGLYEDWTAGKYAVGDIRNANGQTWECFQAHDNATYPDINPDNAAWYTFWRPLHGKTVETARPFVPVQGAHDMYRVGEYMIYTDGITYKCVSDTNFSPTDYPQAWEAVNAPEQGGTEPGGTGPAPDQGDTEPADEWPQWVQPTGAHDAYNTGDKVMYNGKHYQSTINGNVWSPDAYPAGWQLVE